MFKIHRNRSEERVSAFNKDNSSHPFACHLSVEQFTSWKNLALPSDILSLLSSLIGSLVEKKIIYH